MDPSDWPLRKYVIFVSYDKITSSKISGTCRARFLTPGGWWEWRNSLPVPCIAGPAPVPKTFLKKGPHRTLTFLSLHQIIMIQFESPLVYISQRLHYSLIYDKTSFWTMESILWKHVSQAQVVEIVFFSRASAEIVQRNLVFERTYFRICAMPIFVHYWHFSKYSLIK